MYCKQELQLQSRKYTVTCIVYFQAIAQYFNLLKSFHDRTY